MSTQKVRLRLILNKDGTPYDPCKALFDTEPIKTPKKMPTFFSRPVVGVKKKGRQKII